MQTKKFRFCVTSYIFFFVYYSLTRIGTVLLVLHFLPEILLNAGKLFHFAEKTHVSTWLFRVGNVVFIAARFLSVIFAVLTFWFGLEPYASHTLRYVYEIYTSVVNMCMLKVKNT